MDEAVIEDEWERLNGPSWKGLGLSDPIKSIEVGETTSHFLL